MKKYLVLLLLLCSSVAFGLNKDSHQLGTVVSGGGSGDVVGPASSTSGHVATFNGTTGKLIQDGGALPSGDVASIETSVTDNSAVRFNGTGGKSVQKSGVIINDTDDITGVNSIITKAGPVYNVLAWGLDKTGTTDNATAFAALLTALPSTGAKIYFPAGTYRFDSYQSFGSKGNVEIYGDSRYGSKIDCSNANFTNCWRTFGDYSNIHDLWFVAYAGYGHYSLNFTGKYSTLENLYFTGGDGFNGGASNSYNMYRNIEFATDSDGSDFSDSHATFIGIKSNSYSIVRGSNNTFINSVYDSHLMAGSTALSLLGTNNILLGVYAYGATIDISTDSGSLYNVALGLSTGTGNYSKIYHGGSAGIGGFSYIGGSGIATSYPVRTDKIKDIVSSATISYKRIKVTKSYTDFATAGLTNNIEIFSLPAGASIRDCYARVTTTFGGGTIATYTISLGITGTEEKYLKDLDVKTSAVSFLSLANKGSALQISGTVSAIPTNIESFSGVTSIKAFATTTTANLDQATQGAIEIYIEYSDIE